MTANLPTADPILSRRSALALLGAASGLGGLSAAVVPRVAAAEAGRCNAPSPGTPRDLMPGGAYDEFLRTLAQQDQFSGNVLLARAGRPVLERSYGMADKANGVPNSPSTLFALASVTKTLTATAVMQLAQRGEITFETTIGGVLDGFPSPADGVTVHELLTMTSGMDNYYYDPAWLPETRQWSTAAQVLDGTMAIIRERPLLFTPGSQYSYSDSGFVVLGAMVQQVCGQDYWTYLRENIFMPAGMTRTDFYTRPQVVSLLAVGQIAHSYASQRGGGPRVDTSGNPMFIGLPDGSGGPYTTASDLLGFAVALLEGRLVDRSWLDLMLYGKTPLTPRPLDSDPAIQLYFSGYGLEDALINGRHVLSHSGDGPGIATNLDVYPSLGWTAIVLENYDLTPFGLIAAMSPLVKLERQIITRSSWDDDRSLR